MTTEPETVRPEDLRPGDRVRVTLEGVVKRLDEDGDLWVGYDGSGLETLIVRSELALAAIKLAKERS